MKRRFFYHYNKPLSRAKGYPMLSLHAMGKCHIIEGDKLKLQCHTESKVNLKRQPNVVIQGWYSEIITKDGVTIVS